jgi:hypothetical protein
MNPWVFNWCEGLLKNLKKQLAKCRSGWLKQFGYRSILVSLFLEMVPILCLQHVEWGIPAPQDPQMKRWVYLMAGHGGIPIVKYYQDLFEWLRDQLIMVEDYAYVRTDFRGDLDLALPEASQWGETGKKNFSLYVVFGIFNYKMFFSFIQN